MKQIHLDTDLGGDTDDLCALAWLLARPDVDLVGVTTCADPDGLRAGLTVYALGLAGRSDIPVTAGAGGSLAGFRVTAGITDPVRYWPEPVAPRPAPPGAALDLLAKNIAAGATLTAIGPFTNLALLETARPGSLARAEVVLMGGHVTPIAPGLPSWGPDMDYNVQQDTLAARIVFEACDPLLVQLPITLQVAIRTAHLPRLREGGPLARLLAHQTALQGADDDMPALGRRHDRLPDDLLNFHHDPLACAVAAGWDGVTVERLPLVTRLTGGVLTFAVDPDGRPTRVVTAVDAERFAHDWLDTVAPVP